jgi:hypothetical protein
MLQSAYISYVRIETEKICLQKNYKRRKHLLCIVVAHYLCLKKI